MFTSPIVGERYLVLKHTILILFLFFFTGVVLVVVSDDCTFHSLMLKVLPALAMGKKNPQKQLKTDSTFMILTTVFIMIQAKFCCSYLIN